MQKDTHSWKGWQTAHTSHQQHVHHSGSQLGLKPQRH